MASDALQTLARAGLKKIDIAVYTTCLAQPAGNYVHELVKKTTFNRSSIDLSLKRLISMGYIARRKHDKRFVYVASRPEDIVAKQELLLDDMRAAMPMLSRLTEREGIMDSQFYHGYEGLRKAYDQMLLTIRSTPREGDRGHLLAIGNGAKTKLVYSDWQRDFIERRKRLKCWFKPIAPESSRKEKHWMNSPENLRESRFIPDKEFPFHAELEICGDTVMIYTAVEPIGGVIIRSSVIADSMRLIHKMLWNIAKP